VGVVEANQKRIQANLADTRDEAQLLSQRLSVLNRILRHDIRTQTQLLYGYTDRLESGDLSVSAAAAKIDEANQRLIELSEDAQTLQKLFDGVEFENERLDLVTLVHEAGETVQATHERLRIEYDLPEARPVYAPPMLAQAIEHLLYNIVEHTDTDEPLAEVSVTVEETATRPVRLTVADNGPGIPTIEMIHGTGECESQLRHSKGLGLWLVTWIVEEGGGDLDIETTPSADVGTVVTIALRPPPDQPDAI